MSSSGIGRKFHFIRQIAAGGFGSVYLAKVLHGDGFARLAAVKLLHPRWSENKEIASRMRDEARLLGWLRHRNIVEVFDLTRIEGRVAVIMEYLEAVDAKIVVMRSAEAGALLPVRACLEACACVASALDAAYNRPPYAGEKPLRVIHRDIKPSNIMIDNAGTVKVLDFGVARADFDERESHTQELTFGSLEYMPPERLFFEPDSPASDVYSLGGTLYELLALEKLGKAKLRPEQHTDFIAERLDALLDRRELPPELADPLLSLLSESLSFDEEGRPSAADCVQRMRTLARRCPDASLEEWAETTIPPFVREFTEQQSAAEAELADKVLAEEPRQSIFEDSSDVFQRPPETTVEEPDDELTESDRLASARWAATKQAALADMSDLAVPTPAQSGGGAAATSGERPAPTQDPDEPEPPTRSGPSGLLMGLLILSFVGLVVGAVLAVLVLVGGITLFGGDEVPPGTPGGPAEPPPTAAAPVDGPMTTFVSALPNTKKLTVRCDEGQAQGVDRAVVGGDANDSCTVTAMDTSRKRLTVVVKKVEPRVYVCFENGVKECE